MMLAIWRQMADTEGAFLVEDSENLDTCEGTGTIGLDVFRRAKLTL